MSVRLWLEAGDLAVNPDRTERLCATIELCKKFTDGAYIATGAGAFTNYPNCIRAVLSDPRLRGRDVIWGIKIGNTPEIAADIHSAAGWSKIGDAVRAMRDLVGRKTLLIEAETDLYPYEGDRRLDVPVLTSALRNGLPADFKYHVYPGTVCAGNAGEQPAYTRCAVDWYTAWRAAGLMSVRPLCWTAESWDYLSQNRVFRLDCYAALQPMLLATPIVMIYVAGYHRWWLPAQVCPIIDRYLGAQNPAAQLYIDLPDWRPTLLDWSQTTAEQLGAAWRDYKHLVKIPPGNAGLTPINVAHPSLPESPATGDVPSGNA